MRRGRKPVGLKAMTAAERQARHRAKLRKAAQDARKRLDYQSRPGERRPPPHGYNEAKKQLQAEGHRFERARWEFGFEEGLFVDGAFIYGADVVALATLGCAERKQWLDDRRQQFKSFAVDSVIGYMTAMHVDLDDLFRNGHENLGCHGKRHEKSAKCVALPKLAASSGIDQASAATARQD